MRNAVPVMLIIAGVVIAAALYLPLAAGDDASNVSPEQASRLKSQARARLDALPAQPVVREATAPNDDPDAASGTVDFLGPFGITVATVEIGARESSTHWHPWRLIFGWLGAAAPVVLFAGVAILRLRDP